MQDLNERCDMTTLGVHLHLTYFHSFMIRSSCTFLFLLSTVDGFSEVEPMLVLDRDV